MSAHKPPTEHARRAVVSPLTRAPLAVSALFCSTSSASTQMSSPSTCTTRSLSSTMPPSPDLMSLHFHLAQPPQTAQTTQTQQQQPRSPDKRQGQVQPLGPIIPLLASPALLIKSIPPRQQPPPQPQRVTYTPAPTLAASSIAALAAASSHNRPRSLPSSPGHPVIHVDASKMPSSRVYVGNVTFSTKSVTRAHTRALVCSRLVLTPLSFCLCRADELQQFFYESLGVTSEVQIITYPGGKSKGCAYVPPREAQPHSTADVACAHLFD